EHLKVDPVRVAAHHNPLVGIGVAVAFQVGNVRTYITDGIIDSAIGPQSHARHAVATKTYVNTKPLAEDQLVIRYAVVVGVFHPPGVGGDRQEQFVELIVVIDTAENVGHFA